MTTHRMPELPDDLFDSKDWRAADYGGRVEWLLSMYRSKAWELDAFLRQQVGTLREAGFTARDTRIECDECGAKCTPLMPPIHKCVIGSPAVPTAEMVAAGIEERRRGGAMEEVLRAALAAAPKAPSRPLIPHDPGHGQPTMEDARRVIREHVDTLKALHEWKAPADERRPLTRRQLIEAFYEETCEMLYERADFAALVARAVEAAHGIKEQP